MNPRYPAYISYLHYTNEPTTPKPVPQKTFIPKSSRGAINWEGFFVEPVQTFKETLPQLQKPVQKVVPEEITIARPERMLPDDW
jgi:hypothetical protein